MKTLTGTLKFIFLSLLYLILSSCNSDPIDQTIKDIDGNIYGTVKIGEQVWMKENLRVTKFNNGKPIPGITDDSEWCNLTTAAYCWYKNDSTYFNKPYGALYNYHAINSGELCPEGWHVPTKEEFQVLINSLDKNVNFVKHEVSTVAGGKLKMTGSNQWLSPNIKATNESGFSALPGGCRSWKGNFSMINSFGYYGCSTNNSSLAVRTSSSSAFLRSNISGYVGVSVRCIKDQ